MADWIRYKLDRRFDHVLVDEAQDTNAAQWRIIRALCGEFFAGEGAHGDLARTLFVVGDYKQAIFGFQGTSPENFEAAQRNPHADERGRRQCAQRAWPAQARELLELGLERSFRTAAPVLDFVDRAIAHIGHEAFGLAAPPEPHQGQPRPGTVVLWRPVGGAEEAEDEGEEAQNWLSRPEREMANRVAAQLRMASEGYPLVKA
jgi:ATP-dependent helicase/nuclease subunit A